MNEEQKTIPCLRCSNNDPNCPACYGAGFIVPMPSVVEALKVARDSYGSIYDEAENPQ